MKIIHCSDLHLDSKIDVLPSEKSSVRRLEVVQSFERLVFFAKENDVKVIIIAGDAFDTDRITIKTKSKLLNLINQNKDVDFIFLCGNHDKNAFISSIAEVPANLKFFKDKWEYFYYENVCIAGLINEKDNLELSYGTLSLKENNFNIVVLHGQIIGHKTAFSSENVSLVMLKDKNIDYLALGHIHSFMMGDLDERGKYAYSGCLEGRGFDESGKKGFVLLDTAQKDFIKFVPFSKREIVVCEFSCDGFNDYIDFKNAVIKHLISSYSAESVIKLVLKGERLPDFEIDKEDLSFYLGDKFFFVKIEDKTEIKLDKTFYETDKSVRGEFVRLIDESDLDKDLKQKILMCGLNALKGEI